MKNNDKNNVVSFKDKRKQYKKKKQETKKASFAMSGKPDFKTYVFVFVVIAIIAYMML